MYLNFFLFKEVCLKRKFRYPNCMDSEVFRVTVNFRGRVQGVGFRWNVRDEASGFEIAGYVKNLSNGSVELVAEGDEAEVNRFLASVENRMCGYVSDKTVLERVGQSQFEGFLIAY